MNKLYPLFLLIALSIGLCGCPYDSFYGIDETPQMPVDTDLLGKWAAFITKPDVDNTTKDELVKIIFTERNSQEYNFAITGYIDEMQPYHLIENDTIKGTAYLSSLKQKLFLNARIKGKIFIAEVKKQNRGFSILPLSEGFTGKLIKNSKELRIAIGFHYDTRVAPAYDETFTVKNLQKVN
jgi:hypothetical protein